jgi:ribosome maturation factor RimP
MALKETVVKLLEVLINNTEIYLVNVVVSESKIRNKITVFLDTDQGIHIDDCSKISHALGKQLEELIENAFVLEVSSPGADAPLMFERQYIKNIGRDLKVVSTDGTETKGKLLTVNDKTIQILPEPKKKIVFEPLFINIDNISDAKVIVSFK